MIKHKDHFHGSDLEKIEEIYGIKKEEIVSFSANVNPLGVSPLLRTTLADKIDAITTYPDREYTSLRKCIAAYCGTDYENVIVGNGSTELISLFIQIEHPKKAMIIGPTYSEYEREISLGGGTTLYYPLREKDDFRLDVNDFISHLNENIDLLVICNPNNPTGTYVNSAKVEEFIRKLPDHVIPVVDEAYFEYVEDPTHYSLIKMIQEGYDRPLFVLRTFSKIYGMAGLRIGYTFADPLLIDELMKACQAWNVSYNALAAAQAALKDQEYIKKIKALTTAGRKYLEDELTKLGCTLAKPCANFIYFDTHHDPKEIRAALAERKIMISAFGFNRVSVGTEEQNQAFIAALKEILAAY